MSKIGPGTRVSMHFTVSLSSGEVLDSTHDRSDPPTFEFGDGNLLPGFEKAIEGMQAGEQGRFSISTEDGFGIWQEDNVQHFPRHQFGEQFADASGAELPGVIKALPDNAVEVDFNHPLAGRELVFEVDVLRVTDADARPVTLN